MRKRLSASGIRCQSECLSHEMFISWNIFLAFTVESVPPNRLTESLSKANFYIDFAFIWLSTEKPIFFISVLYFTQLRPNIPTIHSTVCSLYWNRSFTENAFRVIAFLLMYIWIHFEFHSKVIDFSGKRFESKNIQNSKIIWILVNFKAFVSRLRFIESDLKRLKAIGFDSHHWYYWW